MQYKFQLGLRHGLAFYSLTVLLSLFILPSLISAIPNAKSMNQHVLKAPVSLQESFPQYDLAASNVSLIIPDWSSIELFKGSEELKAIIDAAVEHIKPVLSYIAQHPWVLIPLLVPTYPVWLSLLGFAVEGVVVGSIAARLQSRIGNVPKGSMFAFFQKFGATRPGSWALARGGIWILIAVLLVVVGIILKENYFPEDDVMTVMEKGWNVTVEKWTMPTVPSLPGRSDAVGAMGGNDLVAKAVVGSLGAGFAAAFGMV